MTRVVKLRSLNDTGIALFAEHIIRRRQGIDAELTGELVLLDEFSAPLNVAIEVDFDRSFKDRFEFGKYIVSVAGQKVTEALREDAGFWTWLALGYFDQFCPKKGPSRHEHYILSYGKWKQPGGTVDLRYRHCARTPVDLIMRFGDQAGFFLKGRSMSQMGDIVEQLCSKDRIMKSKTMLNTLFRLYIDPETGKPKVGCASYSSRPRKLKNGKWSKAGFGGIRRLVDDTLPQIRLTYNIDIMAPNDVISVAGPEFSAFM